MWPHRARQKFRVELTTNHIGMVCELSDLHQFAIRGHTRENHACLFKLLTVRIIELEAVTMPLVHIGNCIGVRSLRPFLKQAWVQSQAHCPAHVCDRTLINH